VLPNNYLDDVVPMLVHRHSKSANMIACIAGGPYHMKPFIILEQAIIEADIILYGYSQCNVLMASQEIAFMTVSLSDRRSNEVFFPAIGQDRFQFNENGADGRDWHRLHGRLCAKMSREECGDHLFRGRFV
jgi:hypothetical protein